MGVLCDLFTATEYNFGRKTSPIRVKEYSVAILQPWNMVFAVGFVVYVATRGKFAAGTKGNESLDRRVGLQEKILLPVVISTSLLFPILYLMTPLFSFADYELPDWGTCVWPGPHGCRTVAVLAFACRPGTQLVADSGNSQGARDRQARRVPPHSASDVFGDLALQHCPGSVTQQLAGRLGRRRRIRRDVLSANSAGRKNDDRPLRN
jgi:hypothetical protein